MIRFYKRVNELNWKYAIGEISLIFVGITLAVWFNNWNQDNIDGRKREQYLLDLRNDLQDDIDEFNLLIAANSNRMRRINSFNALLNERDPDLGIDCDSVQRYMASASFINIFIGSSSVFEDLENTGNLILIDNNSLKRKIMKYYAKIESRKQYENLNSRFHINTIGVFLKKHWNTGALFRLGLNEKGQKDELGMTDCNRTLVTLDEFFENSHLRDELINHIEFSYFIMKENSGEYEVMRREAEELITLMEKE